MEETKPQPVPFKAETRQLLDILIHSLYTEREIFLRELLSNASDALTRMSFEQLTNREVRDPQADLTIHILPNKDEGTLTIRDTGIGMTAEELATNLGTIAQSGAREFIAAAQQDRQEGETRKLADLIGQFGVGFYSAFMAAEWIRVVSLSYRPDAEPAAWFSEGADTYTIEPAEKDSRGTDVIIKLNVDSQEFLEEGRLKEIVRKHSDFIPYPIYIGDSTEQANRQTAIWRQSPREVESQAYDDFYRQFTLDFEEPLAHIHMSVDAPVQMYALLFIPTSPERNIFSLRKEEGLKLYARKILIQEYNKDLLPEYLGFVQGVVDSEDIPLSVSREAVQSTRALGQIKKLLTGKVLDTLKKMGQDDPEKYSRFWEAFSRYIKQGIAIEQGSPDNLYPLLRFHTSTHTEEWTSLDQYVDRMPAGQEKIYYILGDDDRSVLYSPHLDAVRLHGYEVLLLTDPVDPFMLARLKSYRDKPLENVAQAQLEVPEASAEQAERPHLEEAESATLIERFKAALGERVTDVRMTTRLVDSPARLVDPEGAPNQEMQRVYRLLNKDFDAPKKVLELNPRHPILVRLNAISGDDPLNTLVIEQIYEDALLIEGLHPDPAGMIQRIQKLIEAALV
jgi:HSP90 family molecular chaperone